MEGRLLWREVVGGGAVGEMGGSRGTELKSFEELQGKGEDVDLDLRCCSGGRVDVEWGWS